MPPRKYIKPRMARPTVPSKEKRKSMRPEKKRKTTIYGAVPMRPLRPEKDGMPAHLRKGTPAYGRPYTAWFGLGPVAGIAVSIAALTLLLGYILNRVRLRTQRMLTRMVEGVR